MDTLYFWLIFGGINLIFFLPFYLLNFRNQPNPFHFLVDATTSTKQKLKLPFIKFSSDPFRINMDYALVLLLLMILGLTSSMNAMLLGVVAVWTWIIIIYSSTMLFIFEHTPIIIADLKFMETGITILKSWKYLLFVGLFILIGLMLYGMYHLSVYLLGFEVPIYQLITAFIGLAALGLFKPNMEYNMWHQRTVLSPLLYLGINYTRTLKYKAVLDKSGAFFSDLDQYDSLQLSKKPNIEMISVESYGSLLFEDEEYASDFTSLAQDKLQELQSQGYHVASTYSIPPAFAGGSWLSHTTICYGVNIENIHLYNLLFKTDTNFAAYRSLFHYVAKEGYTNILANAIGGYRDEVDWTSIHRQYQYDRLIDAEEIDYDGYGFKFLGVGSVPPDQYSLYKIADIISREPTDNPYFMFFSTLNSHTPFHSPQHIIDDPLSGDHYNSSNKIDLKLSVKERYAQAMKYQIDTVTDYVNHRNADDTIFVLFGDHQPGLITKKEFGWYTPIHVISKDKKLIDEFIKFGFLPDLIGRHSDEFNFTHAGFFSHLMAAMAHCYADSTEEYATFPNGLNTEPWFK